MALVINETPALGYEYIPRSERKEDNPFTVWLKPVGVKELLALEDKVVQRQGEDTVFLASGTFSFRIAQRGISGWRNLEDSNGKSIAIEHSQDGLVFEDSLALLPASMITEIADVLASITRDPATIPSFFTEA